MSEGVDVPGGGILSEFDHPRERCAGVADGKAAGRIRQRSRGRNLGLGGGSDEQHDTQMRTESSHRKFPKPQGLDLNSRPRKMRHHLWPPATRTPVSLLSMVPLAFSDKADPGPADESEIERLSQALLQGGVRGPSENAAFPSFQR